MQKIDMGDFIVYSHLKLKKKVPKMFTVTSLRQHSQKCWGKIRKVISHLLGRPSITHLSALKRIVAQNCWLTAPNLDGGKESQAMEIVSIDSNIRRKKTTRFVASWPPNLF